MEMFSVGPKCKRKESFSAKLEKKKVFSCNNYTVILKDNKF